MASPESLAIQAELREQARLAELRQISDRLAQIENLLTNGRQAVATPDPLAPAADPTPASRPGGGKPR